MVSQAVAQQVQQWPIDRLISYAKNPPIAGSIAAFGFNAPILVDANSGVIAGQGATEVVMTIRYRDCQFRPDSLALIIQANAILLEYARRAITVTLRQLFYQFVARDI